MKVKRDAREKAHRGADLSLGRALQQADRGRIEVRDDITTTYALLPVSFMSLKGIFSSSFIICDICVTKIGSSPIPCHKRSSATKTYFFVINLVTIILSSLICDAHFSS